MMKVLKWIGYLCIAGVSVVGVLMMALTVLVFFLLAAEESGVPASIDYHTAADLRRATGVDFPEVTPVDSSFYDAFRVHRQTVWLVPKNKLKKSFFRKLERACQQDDCWRKDSTGYTYDILPEKRFEDGFDRTKGDGWRMVKVPETGEEKRDWDGAYIRVFVPAQGDTIIVEDGWAP